MEGGTEATHPYALDLAAPQTTRSGAGGRPERLELEIARRAAGWDARVVTHPARLIEGHPPHVRRVRARVVGGVIGAAEAESGWGARPGGRVALVDRPVPSADGLPGSPGWQGRSDAERDYERRGFQIWISHPRLPYGRGGAYTVRACVRARRPA